MAVISKDLGAVTAYAAAVNRGYTGTKEEFETLMASYATVAQQAAESAGNASQSAQSASQSATDAETAKGTAQQAATDAQIAQESAQGYAQSAQQSAQSASRSATDAEAAKQTAVDAVDGFAAGAQQALDGVNSAGNNWKSLAQAQKLDAEAYALGTRDGEDVGSSDPAYHNNAKYYAESAGTDATTASDAAQTATQKASDAQASAEAAAESARTLTIDSTLTQSGQAADSKVVGDKIEEVNGVLSDIAETTTVESKNLFNPTAEGVVTGKYIDTSGNLITLSAWNTSDYIDVSGLSNVVASIWTSDDVYFTYGKMNFLHKYDASKNHLGKVWDVSPNGIYEVGEDVSFIRFCWQPNVELQNGRKMMVESGNAHSNSYEDYFTPYTRTALDPEKIPVQSLGEELLDSDLQAKINRGIPTLLDDIVCWGDSLTYSQYSENTTYPQRLATLTGKTVKNFGMPGASSMDISGLQGGMPIYLAPFTLPADSSEYVDVTFIDANGNSSMYFGFLHYPLRDPMIRSFYVDGIQVEFKYAGSNQYQLRRFETSVEATQFNRPVKLHVISDYSTYVNVFWVGTNDAPTTAEKAQRTVDIIKNMVRHYGGDRFLVLGLTVKSYADAINNILGQTFGNNYVDVKDYLIKYGLADNNLTATAQDETDISNNIVPTSLRHDTVHFNDYGYTAVGNCVYQHGKDMGFWS